MATGLGPEIASAHVAVTASFQGMATAVQRQARMTGNELGRGLTSSASSGARSAGAKAGAEYGKGFSGTAGEAFKNVFVYGGSYAAINAMTSGVKAAAGAVVGFNAKLEQTQVAFTSMLGSSGAATQFIDQMKQFAKDTPFEFADLIPASQKLIAYGFEANKVKDILTTIGDSSAALGAGADGVNRMVLALGQMQSKGKVQAQEMLQLSELGINGYKRLADQLHMTTAEVQDLGKKGKLAADEMIPLLLKSLDEDFGGMMVEQAKTFSGAVSNIRDTLTQGLADAGKGAFDTLNKSAHEFLDYLNSPAGQKALENLGNTITKTAEAASWLAEHVLAVKGPLVALGVGFVAVKAGEAIFIKSAGAAGSFMRSIQGAGSQATISARMQDAYNAALGRTVAEASIAARSIDGVSAAMARQLGANGRMADAKLRAATAAAGTSGTTPFVVNTSGNAAAATSLNKLSLSAAGVGRAFAVSAPMIGVATLALTSLTGTADTAAGKVANFAATGAMVGSAFGPWGTVAGGIIGGFVGIEKSARDAKAAIDGMSDATSMKQLQASIDSGKGSWLTGGLAEDLRKSGSSIDEFKAKLKAGGDEWNNYRGAVENAIHATGRAGTGDTAAGFESVRHAAEEASAGLRSIATAADNAALSQLSASGASYTSAKAFLAAARNAGVGTDSIHTLSQAARSVPSGSTITFSTNALAIMQQINALKAAAGAAQATAMSNLQKSYEQAASVAPGVAKAPTLADQVGAAQKAKQDNQKAVKNLSKSLSDELKKTSVSAGTFSTPPSGGGSKGKGSKGKGSKKAYNVTIYDPFTDDGWQQLTGGQIAKDLGKMQAQADKAFKAMNKGSKTFSKSMKDLAHGKELAKAFSEMQKDATSAITSIQSKVADLAADMDQMGKDIAKAINPANFGMDVSGSADFFGNPIAGSTSSAYMAQLTKKGQNLQSAQTDMATLSGWGIDGDYLQQLLESGNQTLMDEMVAGGKDTALALYGMTKSNDSIASKIGSQVAAQTAAYAADRAEAAALQGSMNTLAAYVAEVRKDAKDGKLSKAEQVTISKFGDEVAKAFKAVMK